MDGGLGDWITKMSYSITITVYQSRWHLAAQCQKGVCTVKT